MMQTTYIEEEHIEEKDGALPEEQVTNDVMQALMELF